MSIYDLDFSKLSAQLLPVDKRANNMMAYIADLLSATQTDHNDLFKDYREGSSAGQFSIANYPYNLNDKVIYKKSIYQSAINNNNTDPTNTINWVLIQENFIGVLERAQYTAQIIILTYAMNKWFGTQFVQPPGQSDIYIVNSDLISSGFIVGLTEDKSADVSTNGSFLNGNIGDIGGLSPFSKLVGYTIMFPTTNYNALDPMPANRESIVRAFVDKYNLAGITYKIQTY